MGNKYTKDNGTKPKLDVKVKVSGLYSLVIGLAELATIYTFATQNNQVLWIPAGILGVDAAIRFGNAFLGDK